MIMKPSPQLKDRAYYEDLYDRNTVEICRETEESLCRPPPGVKATKEEIRRENSKIWPTVLRDVSLRQVAGDRYANRERTITRWIEADLWRDEQLKTAVTPKEITCLSCDIFMDEETKFLHGSSDEKEQLLFLFRCPKCKSGRGIFQDATEWQRPNPGSCKKCNVVLTRSYESKGNQAVTISRCRRCGDEECDELDLDPAKKPSAAEERRFALDRERFCFSEEKGKQYIKSRHILSRHIEVPSMEDRELRKAAQKLKKISVLALEKILKSALSKKGYVRLKFQPPDMEKDIMVKFTVHDEKIEREEYLSRRSLEKCIEAALSETNWRLMSDGVRYRLGVLQGRLRGYEREEDFMNLVRARTKKK